MAENLTTNTRSTPVKTRSGGVFLNIRGDFSGGTATLEWSETADAPDAEWSPLKDINDDDFTRTAPSNATVVGIGRNGYVSVKLAGATSPNIFITIVDHT